MTEATLRPCPFCGNIAMGKSTGVLSCSCVGFKQYTVKKWNSAFCWKELDRLTAENEKLDKGLTFVSGVCDELRSENEKMREALEKIEMMKCEGFDCSLEAKKALSTKAETGGEG